MNANKRAGERDRKGEGGNTTTRRTDAKNRDGRREKIDRRLNNAMEHKNVTVDRIDDS